MDIEAMVMARFPHSQEEEECRMIKNMAEQARASYRFKLAEQYKQQLCESETTGNIQPEKSSQVKEMDGNL